MAKPSIFSKDYEKRIKKRKRRRFFSFTVIVVILIALAFTNNGITKKIKLSLNQIKEETKKQEEQKNKQQEQKEQKEQQNKPKTENNATVKKEKEVPKDKSLDIQLESGIKFKITYIEEKKNKILKAVDTNKNSLIYDVNPSKSLIVISNTKNQNIYLVDLNGNKQDITNKQYSSTSGTAFEKDTILSSNPEYLWSVFPKFIDNENIAYVSQLPWFNKSTKYIWIYNIKNKNHLYTQNIFGEQIKFDKLTEKGLTVIVDGKTVFLKADGNIAQ